MGHSQSSPAYTLLFSIELIIIIEYQCSKNHHQVQTLDFTDENMEA